MKVFKKNPFKNPIFICILTSMFLNLAIEFFSRRSLVEGFKYMTKSPLVFLYNSFIICISLALIFLFKRRVFVYAVICTIWLGFGITNGIILSSRVTPFTAVDFTMIKNAFSLLHTYFNNFQLILICGGLILALIGLVLFFIFAPKYQGKIKYSRNIPAFLLLFFSFFGVTKIALKANIITDYFGNIAFAYLDYGFPYCFGNTLLNTGIDKPTNYSEETINSIFTKDTQVGADEDNISVLASTSSLANEQYGTPNIIFLQLESFFDITQVEGVTFSQDPIPNFRSLSKNYSSGLVEVPSIGAGTANTEFEIISGMSLDYFGPGEYPYKSILKEKPVESAAYSLKDLGYSSHAIHNNKGTFYTRHRVFSRLGFDTFTSIEYMNDLEYTPLGWAKDGVLTEEIIKALDSTVDQQDFIYTISVQGHGDYPEYEVLENPAITVGGIEDEGIRYSYEYYTNEIHEMDNFIGELIEALSNYEEDVVLVMYGDHLPSLGIENENLTYDNNFETPYVMWSNFNLPKEDKNLYAYQLTSYTLDRLHLTAGTLINFHQNHSEDEDYQRNLKLLQYDMLYGNQYIYGGINPFERTKLQMGVVPITISNVYEQDGQVFVEGENFTTFSRIAINGHEKSTTFISPNLLMLEDTELNDSDSIRVDQVTVTNFTLSKSEPYVYGEILDENSELAPIEESVTQ